MTFTTTSTNMSDLPRLYWGRNGPEVARSNWGRGERGGRGGRGGRGNHGARQYGRGRGGSGAGGGHRGGGTAPPQVRRPESAREVVPFPLPAAVASWNGFAADPKPPRPPTPTAGASGIDREVFQLRFEQTSFYDWLNRPMLKDAPVVIQEEEEEIDYGARQESHECGGDGVDGDQRGGGTAPPQVQQLVSAREVVPSPLPAAVASCINFAADPKKYPPPHTLMVEASGSEPSQPEMVREVIQEEFEQCSDNSRLTSPMLLDAPAVVEEKKEEKPCADDAIAAVIEPASAQKALPLEGVGTGSNWLADGLLKMAEALLC
ncbi:hypothetical protein EDC01DRAFT_774772 [Geopyxis carbonaria]|nr:hypothetical protein EDC01DRAFT_774772 [Geopyxis carbonaria]